MPLRADVLGPQVNAVAIWQDHPLFPDKTRADYLHRCGAPLTPRKLFGGIAVRPDEQKVDLVSRWQKLLTQRKAQTEDEQRALRPEFAQMLDAERQRPDSGMSWNLADPAAAAADWYQRFRRDASSQHRRASPAERSLHLAASRDGLHARGLLGLRLGSGAQRPQGGPRVWYEDRLQHITFKELKAVRYAVMSFLPLLAGRQVLLHEDNQAVVSVLTHLTSRSPAMMAELRKLWFLLDTNDIHLRPRYIRSAANIWADRLSRERDTSDWSLNPKIFGHIDRLWGPHTIDRFASMENTLLPRFNARWLDPKAEAVDCLRCKTGDRRRKHTCPAAARLRNAARAKPKPRPKKSVHAWRLDDDDMDSPQGVVSAVETARKAMNRATGVWVVVASLLALL